MDKPEQWYTNKELFEMIQKLNSTMKDTNTVIKKYNGLHERINDVDQKIESVDSKVDKQINVCAEVRATMKGRSDFVNTLIKIWPILITTAMAAFTIWVSTR